MTQRKSWVLVRVARYFGLQALAQLNPPGTVAVDPDGPAVYFFVAVGSTTAWPPMPNPGPLVVTTDLVLPPADRRTPPGTYWLVPPRRGTIQLTDADALQEALADLVPEWTSRDDRIRPADGASGH
ncbi:hypothetical protein AB0F77_26740 [Streptomyces sp. NPDC026672]|uniref:hypothetical protein n=1 Tax=unclassified Streptomyces TaxID=2593676 RepID=UPI0033D8D28C